MKYSIIIPAHNCEATIVRALESVQRAAKGHVVEIIVVDDESSDRTRETVERHAAASLPIILTRTGNNGGPGIARNEGVKIASGDWIGFLDADDELEVNFFAALDAELGAIPEGQPCDIVSFDFSLNRQNSSPAPNAGRDDMRRIEMAGAVERQRVLSEYLLNRIDPSVIFNLFRRDFLHTGNIVFRQGYHEDVDYMFHAFLHARGVRPVHKRLYRKWDTPGSIVNTLSVKHIEGYFDALEAIHAALAPIPEIGATLTASFWTGVANVTASRLTRLLRPAICKHSSQEDIMRALFDRTRTLMQRGRFDLEDISSKPFRTKYELVFLQFMSSMRNEEPIDDIIETISALSRRSWSCYDINNSVFLAPSEIRTCCKRFFSEGRLKGDVVLIRQEDRTRGVTLADIRGAKENLHYEINRDNAPQCRGCPFLTFDDWDTPLVQGIKYLSLEYHSICNMRCVYCDDTYYGGKKPGYDVKVFVDSAAGAGALSRCEYIVWGGGEPTLDRSFAEIAGKLAESAPHIRQRVITNSTVFSPALAEMLSRDKAYIVTSIDAGTEPVFRRIRKFRKFEQVIKNLQRYAAAPHNVIVKYILLEENSEPAELEAFVRLIEENGLQGCNFQISYDFKTEQMLIGQVVSLIMLYSLLRKAGCRYVFADDLIWQRLPHIDTETLRTICEDPTLRGLPIAIADPIRTPRVAVWGTGAQSRLIIGRSRFLASAHIAYCVDPRAALIGSRFQGLEVRPPSALLSDELPIVIAAVQSSPFIYQQIADLGIQPDRVVTDLIL